MANAFCVAVQDVNSHTESLRMLITLGVYLKKNIFQQKSFHNIRVRISA